MNRIALALILVVALAAPASASLQAGLESFERGDYEQAEQELKPIADQGDPRAQYILGIMYLNSFVDAPSSGAAASLIRKAAEQDYLQAQTELARMYRVGDGVQQDYAEMAAWYRRAAEQGDVGAQLFLADSYAYGYGVEPDLVLAYMWYSIAIEYWGPLAVRARDMVGHKMSPEQIADAVAKAADWLKDRGG